MPIDRPSTELCLSREHIHTHTWIGCEDLRESNRSAACWSSTTNCSHMPHSGNKWSAAYVCIHEANPSFNHRSSHLEEVSCHSSMIKTKTETRHKNREKKKQDVLHFCVVFPRNKTERSSLGKKTKYIYTNFRMVIVSLRAFLCNSFQGITDYFSLPLMSHSEHRQIRWSHT